MLSLKVEHSFNPDVNYKHFIGSFTQDDDYPTGGEDVSIQGLTDIVFLSVPAFVGDAGDSYTGALIGGKLQFLKSADDSELAGAAYPAGFFDEAKYYAIVKTDNS